MQTLQWALSELENFKEKVTVYTDSQNIVNLQKMPNRLEVNYYLSAKISHLIIPCFIRSFLDS